jgi:chaperonin cofactor prefoldin
MPPPKRARFEGFIHQKIDRNLQTALSQLAKIWNIPENEVARSAILNSAMEAALKTETKNLSRKKPGVEHDLRRENERLMAELQTLSKSTKTYDRRMAEFRKTLEAALRKLYG